MNSDPSGRRRRSNQPSIGKVTTAVVIAYGTYRLANWAWTAWNGRTEDERHEFSDAAATAAAHNARSADMRESRCSPVHQQQWRLRRARLERCRDEAATALKDFLPTLRRTIEQATDTSAETKALKKLRADKLSGILPRENQERDLWDAVKISAFTRLVSTAYAHSILFLVLTLQVNLLGGRLFHEQMRNQASNRSLGDDSVASDRMGSYQASHRLVLTKTYDYFFQRGIASLVQAVERAVSDVLSNWNVTDPSSMHTSRDMMEEALVKIRDTMEGHTGRRRSRRPRSMMRFLLPPEPDAHVPDELAQAILDETWDLIESPVLEDAQRDCLDVTCDMMRDKYWGTLFLNKDAQQHASSLLTTRPLASVISHLKHTSNSFHEAPKTLVLAPRPSVNIYATALEGLPAVLELADVSFN